MRAYEGQGCSPNRDMAGGGEVPGSPAGAQGQGACLPWTRTSWPSRATYSILPPCPLEDAREAGRHRLVSTLCPYREHSPSRDPRSNLRLDSPVDRGGEGTGGEGRPHRGLPSSTLLEGLGSPPSGPAPCGAPGEPSEDAREPHMLRGLTTHSGLPARP